MFTQFLWLYYEGRISVSLNKELDVNNVIYVFGGWIIEFWFPTLLCYQNENFADAGREPVTFENPLYSTATGTAGDAAVIYATQVKQDRTHIPPHV